MTRQNRDRVLTLSIELVIDCLQWRVVILPDGNYRVFGPVWPGRDPAELTKGRLGYGFALPGIEKAVAVIVKAALNQQQ
jgi:hypothetical protein